MTISNLKIPKIKQAPPYDKDNIAALFDISVYSMTKIKYPVIIETVTTYAAGKECLNLNCSDKNRKYYQLRMKEVWKRPDSKRVWANLDWKDFKDGEGQNYLRLMFQHQVPQGRFLKIQINIFTKENNYKNFYIKRFNHRFDIKYNKDNFYANKGSKGAAKTEDDSAFVSHAVKDGE